MERNLGDLVIYPSKKDPWLILIVVFAGFALVGTGAHHVLTRGFGHPSTWILLVTAPFYGAVIWIFAYPVSYIIAPPNLLIRSGVLQTRIRLSSIEAVRPTRNPVSAPAWSLDRLQIDYRKGGKLVFALISPENKEVFLSELMHNVEGLKLQEDRTVRLAQGKDA